MDLEQSVAQALEDVYGGNQTIEAGAVIDKLLDHGLKVVPCRTTCAVPNCDQIHRARGLCAFHYYRQYRLGEPLGHIPAYGPVSRLPVEPIVELIKGMTIRQAADHLGCSRRQVVRWRQGESKTINVSTADRIATRLDLHLDTLWPVSQETAA